MRRRIRRLAVIKRTDGSWGIWDKTNHGWVNGRHYGVKRHAKIDKYGIIELDKIRRKKHK